MLSNAGTSSTVTSAGTLTTNVHLNPAGLPHVPADVTQANFTLATANTFIVGIGETKPASSTFAVTGNIYGDSDVVLGSNDEAGDGVGHAAARRIEQLYGHHPDCRGRHRGLRQHGRLAPFDQRRFQFSLQPKQHPILDLNGYSQTINSLESLPTGPNTKFAITNSGSLGATLTISGTTTPYYPYTGQINDGPSGGDHRTGQAGRRYARAVGFEHVLGRYNRSRGDAALGQQPRNAVAHGRRQRHGQRRHARRHRHDGRQGRADDVDRRSRRHRRAGLPGQPGTLQVNDNATLDAGANANFTFGLGSNKSLLGVGDPEGGTLTLPTTGSVTINLANAGGLSGTVPLFNFSSGVLANSFSPSQLSIGSAPDPASHYSFSISGNTISVVAPYLLTWSGMGGSDVWDTATTANFTDANNDGNGTFNSLLSTNSNAYDHVTFDDSGSGGTVSIASAGVTPESVTFNNSSKAYTLIGGPIMGATSLVLSGSGTVTLSNSNSYTGGTNVGDGTLIVTVASALPNDGALTVGGAEG